MEELGKEKHSFQGAPMFPYHPLVLASQVGIFAQKLCHAALTARLTSEEHSSWGQWEPRTIPMSVFHSVILLDHHCFQGKSKFSGGLGIL